MEKRKKKKVINELEYVERKIQYNTTFRKMCEIVKESQQRSGRANTITLLYFQKGAKSFFSMRCDNLFDDRSPSEISQANKISCYDMEIKWLYDWTWLRK